MSMRVFGMAAILCGLSAVASAAPISVFSAPHQYANGGVNPCIFTGNGNNGCGQVTVPFPDPVVSTQQFNTNPLVNTYGDDSPTELLQFAAAIGRDFIIGLDVNEGNAIQQISNLTITFFGASNNVLGSGYQLGGTPLQIPFTTQGEGFTDYVVSAGCTGVVVGSGVAATCTNYTPFRAPLGTRSIQFTYGMPAGFFNDGAERLFLIADGGGVPGVITPFDVETVPEPASLVLFGTGALGLVTMLRRRLVR